VFTCTNINERDGSPYIRDVVIHLGCDKPFVQFDRFWSTFDRWFKDIYNTITFW